MKKRIISLLLASAMLLSMTSCKKEELNYAEMTLNEYIDKVKLPENLTISIDPATVEERESTNIYENLPLLNFDDETAQKLLLHNPITETEEFAEEDLSYTAESDTLWERLWVMNGCINYVREDASSNEESVLDATFATYPFVYHQSGDIVGVFKGIYQSADKNLDFASRDEIKTQASSFLKEAGIPDFEVHETVAYDTEALQIAVKDGAVNYEIEPEVTKDDEYYWVLCRQLIDGIPINDYSIQMDEASNWATHMIYLQYTRNGIQNLLTAGIVEPSATGTEEDILSATEILECLKEYYSKGLILKPHDIEELELVYIAEYNEDRTAVSLKPYWLIRVAYQQDYPAPFYADWDGNPLEGEIKAYDHLYFDAVTGEYFEGSTSGKPYD